MRRRIWFPWLFVFVGVTVVLGCNGASPPVPPPPTVDEELRACGQLALAGDTATAEERLSALLARSEVAADPLRRGAALFWRGLSKVSRSESGLAIPDLAAAAEAFGAGEDPLARAFTLLCLGAAEQSEVRLGDAEIHLKQAIATAQSAAAGAKVEGFFLLAETMGAPPQMMVMAETMPALLVPMLGQVLAGLMRGSLADLLLDADRLEEAETELLAAKAFGDLFGGFVGGDIEEKLGHLRRRQGRWDEAREHYLKALAGSQSIFSLPFAKDDRLGIDLRGHLAELELVAGNFPAALRWNDEALAQARKDGVRRLEGRVLAARADLLLHEGRYAEAEKSLVEALAIATEDQNTYRMATAEGDLGEIAFERGDYAKAVSHMERSFALLVARQDRYLAAAVGARIVSIYQVLGASTAATAPVLEQVAILAREPDHEAAAALGLLLTRMDAIRRGRGDGETLAQPFEALAAIVSAWGPEAAEALGLVRGALATVPGADGSATGTASELAFGTARPAFVTIAFRLLRGLHELRGGDLAAARRNCQAALDALAREPNPDLAAQLHLLLAVVDEREGHRAAALARMRRSLAELEKAGAQIQADDLLAGFFGEARGPIFDLYVAFLLKDGRVAEAFEVTERARSRAFLQLVGNRRLGSPTGGDPALQAEAEGKRALLAAWQRELPTAAPARARDLATARAKVQVELEGLLVRLAATNPEYAELVAVAPATLPEIQKALAPGTTLVSYFQIFDDLHAWVVDAERVTHVKLPIEKVDLAAIERFAVAVAEPRGARRVVPAGEGVEELARRLYEKLVAPLRRHLRSENLILVPHGALHYVPFVALVDPKSGRHLLEDFTLVHAPSASVLTHLAKKESPVTGRALVLAAPPRAEPGLDPLDGAAEEGRQVTALLGPGTELLLGAEATEGRLAKLSEPVDLIHVAAHAVFDARAPRFSRLVLAPGPESAGFDGNLEVHELMGGIDWSGVNLVVLSACETARGERTRGNEIVGLTRAVLYAGSPGVISTLWPIDDRSTATLMPRFYRHLTAGRPVAEALRAAQLETLADAETRHPFHWAAFQLHGDPRGRWGGTN